MSASTVYKCGAIFLQLHSVPNLSIVTEVMPNE